MAKDSHAIGSHHQHIENSRPVGKKLQHAYHVIYYLDSTTLEMLQEQKSLTRATHINVMRSNPTDGLHNAMDNPMFNLANRLDVVSNKIEYIVSSNLVLCSY